MFKNNPFNDRGRPVRDPTRFYGRKVEITEAFISIQNGQSISIVGPRRIGKTSLLHYLSSQEAHKKYMSKYENIRFVYLNCEGWSNSSPKEFYKLILKGAWDAYCEIQGETIEQPTLDLANPFRSFEQVIGSIVKRLSKLVIILDEFDYLSNNKYLDADFFSGLRHLATMYEVVYVTASLEPLIELTYTDESVLGSPFFNIFLQKRLQLFSQIDVEDMFAQTAQIGGLAFTEATIDFILDLAGNHPLFLQMAGHHIFGFVSQSGGELTSSDQMVIRTHFLDEAEPHYLYFWRKLSELEKKALLFLPVAYQIDPKIIKKLGDYCLAVDRDGRADFLSSAFREFVSQQDVPGLMQAYPVTLDPFQKTVLLRGRLLNVTPTEYNLLKCLVEHVSQVMTPSELESCIWSDEFVEDPERLKSVVKTLRAKLESDRECIENVRGVGYRFKYQ